MKESASEHENKPKHFFCISVYSFPSGDRSDTTTSSSRVGLEKVMLAEASVIATPELCCSDPIKVQTLAIVFDVNVVDVLLLAESGRIARKVPKLDPVTLMLLMLCEVALDVAGVM